MVTNGSIDDIQFSDWFEILIPQNDSAIFWSSCKAIVISMHCEYCSLQIKKNRTRFIKHCDSRVGVYHQWGRIHPLGCCRCVPLSSKLSSMYRRNVNKLNKPTMMLFFFFFFLLLTQTAFPQIRWNKSHHKSNHGAVSINTDICDTSLQLCKHLRLFLLSRDPSVSTSIIIDLLRQTRLI